MSLPAAARQGSDAPAGPRAGRLPRFLHPVAWWAWAVGLMLAASRTSQPLLLGLILGVLGLVVVARRPEAAWARAFSAALRLGVIVIVARILLQIIVGAPVGLDVAFTLPSVTLPDWMAGVRLGGLVTWGAIVVGFCEGLRLAVMIACVGAANSLSAPSRLLRSVPAALYELGVAVVVALTFAPHLLDDARRVGAARRLRGHDEGRLRAFARSGGPVLDGGLERSIQLAAAMDSRGYGRAGELTVRQQRTQTALILAGFAGVLVGLYGLFDSAAPRALGWPTLALGALLAAAGLQAAGRRSTRSAYRPDPWRWPEWATSATGVVAAVVFLATPVIQLLMPVSPLTVPTLDLVPALAVLLCAGPALWTPPVPGLRAATAR